MTLSITPVSAVNVAQGAATGIALQPGTVVDAQVLKLLDANLVRIAIASLTLDVATSIPLQEGQTLQLAVSQTADGFRLAVVDQGSSATAVKQPPGIAPDAPQQLLTPAQALAVSVATQDAAARQTSLAPLFANLAASADSGSLPSALQQAAAQVLALRPALDQNLSGGTIKAALQTSGLFREAGLSAGSSPSSPPDLKAALIVLRQTLSTFLQSSADDGGLVAAALPGVAPTRVKPDGVTQDASVPHGLSVVLEEAVTLSSASVVRQPVSASALGLLQAIAHGTGDTTTVLPTETLLGLLQLAGTASRTPHAEGDSAHTNTPPPPFRGALPSAQPIAAPSLAPDAPPATTARQLLEDTDSAIARQTLLQVASLPDRADVVNARLDPIQPRWAFEIPFATPQGTAMAQFEIARDGGGNGEAEAAKRVWRARFSLDVEPAGPVHALISFSGETTSVRMWAERPATAAQLRANAADLGDALRRAQLHTGDIVISQGAPASTAAPAAGHFLDRAS